jgi:hypothetical protein
VDPSGGGRYGLLLLVLIVTYLMSAFITGTWVSVVQIVLFVVVAILAVRGDQVRRRTAHVAIALAIGGSAVAVTLALTHSADTGAGVANLWTALVLLFAVVLIVRRILSQPVVTMQSIFGAVSAYMILGLMFASLYAAMNRFGAGAFFAGRSPGNIKTFQYFSFTTLTTLGYGDFTAAGSGGQAVAVMEALIGQVFLATLVARLVAAFRGTSQAAEAGRAAGPRRQRPPGRSKQAPARRGRAPSRSARARRISSRARARPARR